MTTRILLSTSSKHLSSTRKATAVTNTIIKKAIVKTSAALAAGVAAISLAACSTSSVDPEQAAAACAEMRGYHVPSGSQSVVALFDASGSMRDGGWVSPAFASLVQQAAGVYSTLSVLWVGGEGETPVWAIDNLPLNNEKYEFGTKHYNEQVERVSSCVASMIGSPATAAPGTDLGTAIQVGADRLAETSGPKRLIVVSDGLSNAGPIDLTGVIATTAVDTLVAKLDTTGYAPNLTGVDVTFAGLGVTSSTVTDGPTVTWLKNYYSAVCERGGAASCDAPVVDQGATADGTAPRADAPEDPDLALPAIQFEFDDSEVRFEPDSAVITASADAALGQAAACLRDGSTLTVIGHSAYVGDAAGEQAMSEERARTAANRIMELAGHPIVTVNAFGVGSTEPKSASGHEPEDRRVHVALTGVCS